MPQTTHELTASMDNGSANVTCSECDYAFIAPVDGRGIALGQRIWLDRGDRSVAHAYMAPTDRLFAIAMNAMHSR